MRKPILIACSLALLGGAAGCLGGDPNKNSQIYTTTPPTPAGTGGTGSGTGGSSGPVTGPIKGTPYATFNTNNEAFQLNVYHDTGALNLGDPASGHSPTLSWDSTVGSPDPGSIKVVADYTGANQYVDIQKSMTMTPQNWSNGTFRVRIRVTEGTVPGGAQIYVITVPNQYVFGGTFTNVAMGSNWQEFQVNLENPMTQNSGYDPSQVIIVGVQLNTGSAGGTARAVTFNIDSFSIEGVAGGTGGMGGGGGATGTAGSGGTTGAGGTTGTGGTTGAAGSGDASAGG